MNYCLFRTIERAMLQSSVNPLKLRVMLCLEVSIDFKVTFEIGFCAETTRTMRTLAEVVLICFMVLFFFQSHNATEVYLVFGICKRMRHIRCLQKFEKSVKRIRYTIRTVPLKKQKIAPKLRNEP